MVVDFEGAIKNKRFMLYFDKTKPARFTVFKRDAPANANGIKFFNVDAHYCFHYCNSWDSVNEEGHDVVTIFAINYETIDMAL